MVMKKLIVQLLTSFTATGMITFAVTHMHMKTFSLELMLWIIHWLVAWPIAFINIRWIASLYQQLIDKVQ
jgi:hypothetical protein